MPNELKIKSFLGMLIIEWICILQTCYFHSASSVLISSMLENKVPCLGIYDSLFSVKLFIHSMRCFTIEEAFLIAHSDAVDVIHIEPPNSNVLTDADPEHEDIPQLRPNSECSSRIWEFRPQQRSYYKILFTIRQELSSLMSNGKSRRTEKSFSLMHRFTVLLKIPSTPQFCRLFIPIVTRFWH